ncbi:alpha/beta fold hydrolase [Cnuibacter physcomitrellae]|uniref:alpha/beta hydrolase n=1 Tax=Cnuibacter physcomitrellae TaxID=1619308 RepID=UPI002175DB38|nr:alpha/beta hydrolase [Cnuibacter physcomitrellae]MCS5498231.1 alpha/beta fold hydrolase [Cnuibacter physcomitrellae]
MSESTPIRAAAAPPFVLLHGGRHGGWAWQRVAPHLIAAGHAVHTPTLTGLGERSHLLTPEVGLETHVADLLAVFERDQLDDVVLVAHSYGGIVACAALETLRDRVRSLVLIDAQMPLTGESLFDVVDPAKAEITRELIRTGGDGWFIPVSDASFWGLSDPADIAWVNTQLTPQPARSYSDPVTSTEYAHTHPYTFVECSPSFLSERELEVHRRRAAADPGRVRYLRAPGGHEAMVSHPEGVAQILLASLDPPSAAAVGGRNGREEVRR